MKLIIAGGRDFANFELMVEKLDHLLSVTEDDPITVISGTARGADQLGEKYANLRGYDIERYPANWDRDGRSAGYKRNELMAQRATHCVVFWDGQSRGSRHMFTLARAKGIPTRVVRY